MTAFFGAAPPPTRKPPFAISPLMPDMVRRGFVPSDAREFGERALPTLQMAARETAFLLDHGYGVKQSTTFVGNHHQLSERQRLALARAVSSENHIQNRRQKCLPPEALAGKTLSIDGFNLIITLETAFSGCTLLRCMDDTVRDLAGLRGSYRLIDKTERAIRALLDTFTALRIGGAVFFFDAPVSNSGRLAAFLHECAAAAPFHVETILAPDVDARLQERPLVLTSDAIILDACAAWCNLTPFLLEKFLGGYPYVDLRIHL